MANQPLFRQLEEGAGQVALKTDFESPDIIDIVIGMIEQATGLDLTILKNIVDGIQDALGGILDVPTAIFNSIVDAINQFITDLLGLLDAATGGFFGLTGLAGALNQTHSTATTAQSTAVTASTNANTALTNSNTANTNATAAQIAASNAATVAATAQGVAEIAYENAQYDSIQFSVSTAAVQLYKNEEIQGILLLKPSNRTMKITRVIYTLAYNNGTMTIQLIKKLTNGTESVVHTTNVTASTLMQVDVSIDYTVADLDRYLCNVTAVTGQPSGLYCCLETVLIE